MFLISFHLFKIMPINLENLIFFAVFLPIVVAALLIVSKLKERCPQKIWLRFLIIEIVLFLTRVFLLVFDLGSFPDLEMDPLFYALAFFMGLGFMYVYVTKIEGATLKSVGWFFKVNNVGKQLLYGFLGCIALLIASVGLMAVLLDYQLSTDLSIGADQFITALFFGLGAIYEEWFFRGLIYQKTDLTSIQKISISSLMFLGIHVGYLSFTGYGVYYITMAIMALMLGYLAYKLGIISSATAHGFYVFIGALTA